MNQRGNGVKMSEKLLDKQQEVKYRDYRLVFKVVINISLASTYSGYCLAYFNTINFDDTVKIFSIRYDRALMQGLLSFCVAIGAAFGGYCATYIINRFSRRQGFLTVAYFSLVATLLLQSKSIFLIICCRIIQGISVGMTSVMRPLYIKQFAPLQLAAKFGAINQIFFAIGLTFAFTLTFILSTFLTAQQYWRIVYLVPTLFLLVQIYNLKINYPYQTPKYLLEKGRKQQAIQLMTMIYKPQYVEERVNQLQKLLHLINKKQDIQMKDMNNSENTQIMHSHGKSNKVAIIVAYSLSSMQQITGIQVIILYAGEMMLSLWPHMEKIIPIILQVQGLLSTLVLMNFIGHYGRKQIIQKGLLIIGFMHFLVGFAFLWKDAAGQQNILPILFVVFGLFVCRGVFSLSIGPIVWLYLPQIVEPDTISKSTMINWLTAAIVSFIYPILVQLLGGPALIFMMFGTFVFAGIYMNEKLMVETKDKAQWQVRKEYDEKLHLKSIFY